MVSHGAGSFPGSCHFSGADRYGVGIMGGKSLVFLSVSLPGRGKEPFVLRPSILVDFQ